MIKDIKATIEYDTKANHPDEPTGLRLKFTDTYHVDMDRFYDMDSVKSYIKHDLALVAGGGYETNTIENVNFIIEVQ